MVKVARPDEGIHTAAFVRDLFGEMSATYGRTNLITSLGFCSRWRRQCVRQVRIRPQDTVCDLMSGMGELWPAIGKSLDSGGRICAIDFSPEMCRQSNRTADRIGSAEVEIRQEDVLKNTIPDDTADVVLSSFGLKTFSPQQRATLAREVARILRPGGRLSLLEISVPRSRLLRFVYMLYLKYAIPFLGRILLGNPDNYRMLGIYTEAFEDCESFMNECTNAGLRVQFRRFFFGCATAVVGEKPA